MDESKKKELDIPIQGSMGKLRISLFQKGKGTFRPIFWVDLSNKDFDWAKKDVIHLEYEAEE